jgi:type II secretory pathway component GspD/PulD (secretin)
MLMGVALGTLLLAQSAGAQTESAPQTTAKPADRAARAESYQTIPLNNVSQQNDATDVVTALRNVLPRTRVYYVASQGVISVWGTADEIQLAQKIVAEIDLPKKVYRLTYAITEMDAGKRVGTEHYSLVVSGAARSDFKQGSRVPIVTGKYDADTSAASSQVQYQDVGLSIQASMDGFADGLRLHTKIEQTSIAEEKSSAAEQDPVIRQTVLEATSRVVEGKPEVLGTLDIPGSTRHEEIEVTVETVK